MITLYTIGAMCFFLLVFGIVMRVTPSEAMQMVSGIWNAIMAKEDTTANHAPANSKAQGK